MARDPRIIRYVTQNEGYRERRYYDSRGIATVGVGFNLERQGARAQIEALGHDYNRVTAGDETLTRGEVETLLDRDISAAEQVARSTFSNFNSIDVDRQMVLIDLSFNLGATTLGTFANFIAAVERSDWSAAADELVHSRWYTQVGRRAVNNVATMRTGQPPASVGPKPKEGKDGKDTKEGKDSSEKGKEGKEVKDGGDKGKDTKEGKDGKDSTDKGKDAKEGKDGKDGTDKGKDSKEGKDGKDSTDKGKDGKDSTDKGKEGKDGKDATDKGKDGKDSTDKGKDGKDGKDSTDKGKDGKDTTDKGKEGKDGKDNLDFAPLIFNLKPRFAG